MGRADGTECVHAGEDRHGRCAPLTTEIAQTSVFALPGVEELRRLAAGTSSAYMYTRYANPTVRVAEEKIAALEGAEDCVATASGMAAIHAALLAVARAGDEIVSMLDVYGGTLHLFERVLGRCGIGHTLVPFDALDRIESFFTPRTRVLFLETPTNPTLRCIDLEGLASKARARGIAVMVDNTFATPLLQRPLELGADLSIHSATKYLGGHSDVTAGAVCGSGALVGAVREVVKLAGGTLDPGCAYLLIRGLKTLDLRMERSCRTAAALARAMQGHTKVRRVHYPGLAENEGHVHAVQQMRDFGAMLSLELEDGAAAERFIDRLRLWQLASSLGGVESTVSYPALSSHAGLPEAWLRAMGVTPGLVRLSAGVEDEADLIADLEQALG